MSMSASARLAVLYINHLTNAMSRRQHLYREEVLRSKKNSSKGELRLDQPIAGWIVAVVANILAVALLGFIFWGTVARKTKVQGLTVSVFGSVAVVAPSRGVISRVLVKEGQYVKEGAPLFVLSTAREGTSGELSELVEQQLALRKQNLDSELRLRVRKAEEARQSIESRLRNMDGEAEQLDLELGFALRRHELAGDSLKQFEELLGSGFASSAQLLQKQQDQLDAAARLGSLRRTKTQLTERQLSLKSERDSVATSLSAELAQINDTRASLEQQLVENLSRKAMIVSAPQGGRVTSVGFHIGLAVAQGQTLATLVRTDGNTEGAVRVEAQIFVPSGTAGFIAPGQDVLIRYSAFPFQKYGLQKGRVLDISDTPFTAAELPSNLRTVMVGADQREEGRYGFYRVRVGLERQSLNLDGQTISLRPGMPLDADIVRDRRRLWEWIVGPLSAISFNGK